MKTLVIGYGNILRGDDGVGPRIAEQVTALELPEVQSRAVHQLTPELAAEIAQVEIVFFIDAYIPDRIITQADRQLDDLEGKCHGSLPMSGKPRCERLCLTDTPTRLDHVWSPPLLLQLAKALYQAEPIAYHLLIPALHFDYGKPLSAIALNSIDWAIQTLQTSIREACYA